MYGILEKTISVDSTDNQKKIANVSNSEMSSEHDVQTLRTDSNSSVVELQSNSLTDTCSDNSGMKVSENNEDSGCDHEDEEVEQRQTDHDEIVIQQEGDFSEISDDIHDDEHMDRQTESLDRLVNGEIDSNEHTNDNVLTDSNSSTTVPPHEGSRSLSPYVLIGSNNILNTGSLESAGLFYAHLDKIKDSPIDHSSSPPPESADDVLLSEIVVDEVKKSKRVTRNDRLDEIDSSSPILPPPRRKSVCYIPPLFLTHNFSLSLKSVHLPAVDPTFIFELDKHTQNLASELDEMMEGLKTNLHAVCPHHIYY